MKIMVWVCRDVTWIDNYGYQEPPYLYRVYFKCPVRSAMGDWSDENLAFKAEPDAWNKLSNVRLDTGGGPVKVKLCWETSEPTQVSTELRNDTESPETSFWAEKN